MHVSRAKRFSTIRLKRLAFPPENPEGRTIKPLLTKVYF